MSLKLIWWGPDKGKMIDIDIKSYLMKHIFEKILEST